MSLPWHFCVCLGMVHGLYSQMDTWLCFWFSCKQIVCFENVNTYTNILFPVLVDTKQNPFKQSSVFLILWKLSNAKICRLLKVGKKLFSPSMPTVQAAQACLGKDRNLRTLQGPMPFLTTPYSLSLAGTPGRELSKGHGLWTVLMFLLWFLGLFLLHINRMTFQRSLWE